MSRAHSGFIPADQISQAKGYEFGAVDQAALRFAAKLKAQAEAEDRVKDQSARQAGHAAGYAEGFAQGHAQATLEGQKQIAQYIENQGQAAAQQFLTLMQSARDQLAASEQAMAQGVLELACALARQVLRHELSSNPNAVQSVLRESLAMLSADGKVATVRLHPAAVEVFTPELQRSFANLELTLLPDASLSPGSCMVESAGSVIDGSVERRWQRVVASLGLESSWEDGGASV